LDSKVGVKDSLSPFLPFWRHAADEILDEAASEAYGLVMVRARRR
jgi:hypothetical protein